MKIQPELSSEVIATYVADAARATRGVVELHGSAWKELSSRVRDGRSPGIVVHQTADSVDVEIHVKVAWQVHIPTVAQNLEDSVRTRARELLHIELGTVTVFVDGIELPTEIEVRPEG